jgi:hypothetical protein
MKAIIKIEKEVNFTYLKIECGARYWEDAEVNGVEDSEGTLIPFRKGDYWCPVIELDTGIIKDWPKGTTAKVHYKCCDDGEYWLIADDGYEVKYPGYYVPNILDLTGESYGDYVILVIDENGKIDGWPSTLDISDFLKEEDE